MRKSLVIVLLLLAVIVQADRRSNLASQKSAAAPSSLNTGLVLLWKLNEPSGTRFASVGGLNLTDNGSVGTNGGPTAIGPAAGDFDGSSQWLSHADTAALRMGDFNDHWVVWFLGIPTVPGMVIGKDDAGDRGFIIWQDGSDNISFEGPDASSVDQIVSTGPITAGWDMIDFGYDKDAGEWFIRLNNGSKVTGSFSHPGVNTAEFNIGRRSYSGFESYWAGRISYIMRWNRILSGAEITQLYNSGSGLAYPF